MDIRKTKIGDILIRTKSGFFSRHYAMFVGYDINNGKPIVAENQVSFGVRYIYLEQFLKEGRLTEIRHKNFNSSQQNLVTSRVRERLGKSYDWLMYNCEHFVNDVLTGTAKSKQIENGALFAAGALLLTAVLTSK